MKCDHDMDRNRTTQQTVNATINENTTYSYVLPMVAKGSVPVISTSAAHASASVITTDGNGNLEYRYTPATNYTGTDVVVITTHDAPQQGGCFGGGNMPAPPPGKGGGGQGHCNHPGDNTTVTTIAITVNSSLDILPAKQSTTANHSID